MKQKYISLLFILHINIFFSQILKTDYICTYKLDYVIKGKVENEQFIMFIDAKNNKSFFQSSSNYVKDTINISDPMKLAMYESDFNEKILFENNKFSTFEKVIDYKIHTNENQNLTWIILNTTKKIENINLQLAKTNAYGRVWYAWFSSEIPIDFGPYKFKGLPGLIVSIYDENKEFSFELQKFKKKNKTIKLPNRKFFKNFSKMEYNKNRFKLQTSDIGIIFDNPKDRIVWFKKLEDIYLYLPKLDITYPVK